MAILKWTGIDNFLRRDAEQALAVLIYGPDGGTVRERARQLVISVAGSLDDPFAVMRLDDAELEKRFRVAEQRLLNAGPGSSSEINILNAYLVEWYARGNRWDWPFF